MSKKKPKPHVFDKMPMRDQLQLAQAILLWRKP